jgi:cob(I)alamin adenosyltransferase
MSMKIYTRTGDEGETGLFGGGRVPKDHARVAAYGEVDELNSAIGVARATQPVQFFDPVLELVQRDLFAIGGHLATPDPDKVAKALEKADLSADHVTEFERVMDAAEQELPPLRAFVLPARGAERGSPGPRARGAGLVRGLSQPALRPAVHARAPRQPSGRRGRRHLVSHR